MMEISALWPQKQWLAAFIDSSSLSRVDEWVSNLYFQSALPLEECGLGDAEEIRKSTDFSPLEMNVIPEKTSHITHHSNFDLSEEVIKANNIIKFLNSFTSTARIVGMGLKVIPNIHTLLAFDLSIYQATL
ncbi:hypothetical protein MRB53_033516 [Persea americana]|uniref:Uncharacterized protein n=1 Tax=Persea americana TaxID=3435 RepID=A0ACC2KUP8_PERAE|nr:hypothetical protein MRB53_033516 [Persea americana]